MRFLVSFFALALAVGLQSNAHAQGQSNVYYNHQGNHQANPQGNANQGKYAPSGYANRYSSPGYGYRNTDGQAQRTSSNEPEALVREGIAKLQAFMRSAGGTANADSLRFVEQTIAPYFDFEYMAKWAAGPRWRYLSHHQQAEMSATVRRLFLAALARNVAGYGNPRVTVHRARKGRGAGELTVPVTVTPRQSGGGMRMRMTFRFYKSSEGWKVFDVTANNTSAVMYYRRYFNQQNSRY
ncbi:MAG: MlaC/ttg2D family ABC transporter substrate-binding protein [Gammaproteobacteria bacterium]